MKKIISLVLLFSIAITANAVGIIENMEPVKLYTINTPYEYPIVPGTAEWEKLETNVDKINACAVPNKVINNMTTEALLKTYLTHPMIINLFAYDNDYDVAFNMMKSYYNIGLDELVSREDVANEILKSYSEIEVFDGTIEATLSNDERDMLFDMKLEESFELMRHEILAAQIELDDTNPVHVLLKNEIAKKSQEKQKNLDFYGLGYMCYYDALPYNKDVELQNYEVNIVTPKGNLVRDAMKITEEWSQSSLDKVTKEFEAVYKKAKEVAPATAKYNCHSYAWHSQSTDNDIWLFDPTLYMTDGSYSQTASARANTRIYYSYETAPDPPYKYGGTHSGIVTNTVNTTSGMYVRSKWAAGKLYDHEYNDCPYYHLENGQYKGSITYWYR